MTGRRRCRASPALGDGHDRSPASCESGVASPVGADELLGMASALMPLGTASILASVLPVNDAATAPVMVAFHERLRAGVVIWGGAPRHQNGRRPRPDSDRHGMSFVALGR